ncbi:hypothetical protein [Tenacibaculum caenipelagi]|uniref:Uncharacterized protein n=1 Tax=Tenacibaculum caenipelagi TaxID=1325435 RepID=A0A4R6TE62_9FLAO|nr:hypothetical protein [Tenacibaculum caenipelagi]TDQ22743.1 hypothetical protein DFQ07_2761 [Tenacibaculum caenipelagi]
MKDLLNIILGNNPISNTIGFVFFTLFGMVLIKMLRYNIRKKKLRNQEPPVILKFDLKHWLNDNLLDFVCAFVTSFLVYRFLHDTLVAACKYFATIPQFNDDMFYGLLLGLCFQYISHKIMNKLTIV